MRNFDSYIVTLENRIDFAIEAHNKEEAIAIAMSRFKNILPNVVKAEPWVALKSGGKNNDR